jgi:tRNA A37 threonylcarbamoyladenosine dehydratase
MQVMYRPLIAAYVTRAGLIRALDGPCATVLLDEGEHYINPMQRGNTELIAVLNSGNRRGSYTVMVADITETDPDGTKRVVKKPVRLDTYSGKCIVSRKPIFDTLEDRSVQIVMPKASQKMPPIDKASCFVALAPRRGSLDVRR